MFVTGVATCRVVIGAERTGLVWCVTVVDVLLIGRDITECSSLPHSGLYSECSVSASCGTSS